MVWHITPLGVIGIPKCGNVSGRYESPTIVFYLTHAVCHEFRAYSGEIKSETFIKHFTGNIVIVNKNFVNGVIEAVKGVCVA